MIGPVTLLDMHVQPALELKTYVTKIPSDIFAFEFVQAQSLKLVL